MNIPPYGDSYKRLGAYFSNLQVSAQTIPNMTVKVSTGGFWYYSSTGASYLEYVGGNSPTLTAPNSNAKWDIIAMTSSGTIVIIPGSSSSNPVLPTLPGRNRTPLAAVYLQSTSTTITNDMIFDIRPLFPLEVRDHRDLEGSSNVNLHPITAISNLSDTLDGLVTNDALEVLLAAKADQTGTNNTIFLLNQDFTSGVPSSDCILEVQRGSETNVGIKWDENNQEWSYTNNGTNWINFTSYYLNDGTSDIRIQTHTQTTEPVLDANGKMCFWIDSDGDNKVYLVYRRGEGDHVKVELTSE